MLILRLKILQDCNASTSLSCFCTDVNIDSFTMCMDCMVSVDSGGVDSLIGQTAIDGEHEMFIHFFQMWIVYL